MDIAVIEALRKVRSSGRKLLLVTGRKLDELLSVFPRVGLFDAISGKRRSALLAGDPQDGLLSAPVPGNFVNLLVQRDVQPLSVGHVIVATREPQERVVIEAIRELGLELQVIFNKGAVMVLPALVNKATGLHAALSELCIPPACVVGVGDAENDHVFLAVCGYSVAVANAIPALTERAHWVTPSPHGIGVIEMITKLMDESLP